MKKNITASLLLLFIFNVALAQVNKKKVGFRIMFHGGVNFSNIKGDSESYSGSVIGANLGVSAGIVNITKELGVEVGLGYSMQGSGYEMYEYEPGGGSRNSKAKVALDYIQIPVTAAYRSKMGLYGELGLAPAVLISAKDKHDGEKENIKEDYKGFDIGLLTGIGYEFKQKYAIGFRFVPGLTNINKSSGANADSKDRNSVFSLRVSYKL